jgi:hypothetical protein
MHFLEQYLVLHPVLLYAVAIGFYLLNLVLYARADQTRRSITAVRASSGMSLRARLSATVVGALMFLIPGLFFSGELRALFVGGFLVMQFASLTLILLSMQTTATLRLPGAVVGEIAYSRATVARFSAANLLSVSLFALLAFALTGSPSLFSAAAYLAITSVGYRRRARQFAANDASASSSAQASPAS